MSTAARLIGGRGYPRQALDWMASEHPGQPLATAAIAEKLGIWLSDVHSTMYNLVLAGYIDKIVDPGDARRTLYAITAAGIEHSKLLSQLPAVAPVKLGPVHRRHKAKNLETVEGDSAAAGAGADAEAPAAEPAPAPAPAPAPSLPYPWPMQRTEESAATIGRAMPEEPDAADPIGGGASTQETPADDDVADDTQPETRQHARLAHKMGRPLFSISATGEVRVLLPRLGMSVYLQPDTLHKLAAASALVRQAGGLA
jgi:DNA-binding MarR family transcriptional regulator